MEKQDIILNEDEDIIEDISLEELQEKVNSEEEFTKYATELLKKVHGDDFDEDKAENTIETILKKTDGDFEEAVNMIKTMAKLSKDDYESEDDEEEVDDIEEAKLDKVGDEDDDIDNDGDSDESDEYLKKRREAISKATKKDESTDYVDDLNNLVESDETLSEDFKEKAGIIFEAALTSRLREEAEKLQEEFDDRLIQETENIRESLSQKIDDYLTYAVESWVEDNKIAIESGLRTEVAESFIDALKNVFVEHYIEVPETKKDLVEELENKVKLTEQALSETETKANELNEQVEKLSREKIIAEASDSLAETQQERLRKLVEDIEFIDTETFVKKVKTIKECYFKDRIEEEIIEEDDKSSYTVKDIIVEEDEEFDDSLSPEMKTYLKTLKKMNKK